MWDILSYLSERVQLFTLILGTWVGSLYSYVMQGMPNCFPWFLIFVIVDYLTGMLAAFKTKTWSSSVGFKGINKKFIAIVVVILANGIATMIGLEELEIGFILVFSLNEFCSILENINRAGYEHLIPDSVNKLLGVLKTRTEEKIDNLQ